MNLKLVEVKDKNTILINKLLKVWEESVRAIHLFLSDIEIENIAGYIPQALKSISALIVAIDNNSEPIAFMGIEGRKLEMLFISPKDRGKGIGKRFIQYGLENYSINEVGVNEQNPQARGFYEHMGFQDYKRTETDEQGNPYPILYMRLL